ncbi:hypothetical protein BZL35_00700 [Candidatus Pandoraea novymonadis]|uniref:Uncharacterized protein n=1 Tax=Candidatus Pandoraea novymonadis TaxID=1808959 RepID=A0ABX5FH92_9BURK|nr:hypothetical protein BZL35_00700 [Candidatus Pandoraea novymonadis]
MFFALRECILNFLLKKIPSVFVEEGTTRLMSFNFYDLPIDSCVVYGQSNIFFF